MSGPNDYFGSRVFRVPRPITILAAVVVVWGATQAWRQWSAHAKRERMLQNLTAEQATPTERTLGAEKWAEQGAGALPELNRALEHDNPAVREGALFALRRMGPDARDAIPHVVKCLNDESPGVRKATIAALAEMGHVSDDAVPKIVDALGNEDLGVREAAHLYLKKFGAPSVAAIRRFVADPGAETRRRAVELLAEHGRGDEASIEAIRTRLTDEAHEVRHVAFGILADWHELSIDEITAGLRDAQPSIVALAVAALQSAADDAEPAIPQLVELLRHDDARIQLGVLNTLQHLGPRAREATPELVKLAGSDDDRRYNAVSVLLEIGVDAEALVPLAREVALSQPCRHGCRDMLWRLHARYPDEIPSIVDQLIGRLSSADYVEWCSILYALRGVGSSASAALPILLAALDEEDGGRRQQAAWSLGAIGPAARDAVPKLVDILEYEVENSNCSAVIVALAKIGPDARSAIPAIKTVLERTRTVSDETDYESSTVRASVIFALGRLGAGDASNVQLVLQATMDPSPNVRRCAVSVLAESGCDAEQAVPALQACLGDAAGIVQVAAARALGEFADAEEQVVPLLVEALSQADSDRDNDRVDVRLAAAETLGRFGPKARSAVPLLLDLLDHKPQRFWRPRFEGPYAQDPEWVSIRSTVLEALRHIDPDAAAAVRTQLGRRAAGDRVGTIDRR